MIFKFPAGLEFFQFSWATSQVPGVLDWRGMLKVEKGMPTWPMADIAHVNMHWLGISTVPTIQETVEDEG